MSGLPFEADDPGLARFAELVGREGPEPDAMAEAALELARLPGRSVDTDHWLGLLEGMAADVRRRLPAAAGEAERLQALCAYLFQELAFRGNEADYYHPDNSFLDRVLGERTGIPISLALVTIEVGRRVGVALSGVGFPAHFLVGIDAEQGRFLDPFHGGRRLDVQDCRQLLRELSGGSVRFLMSYLAPISPRSLLTRMCFNLKGTLVRRRDLRLASAVQDRILVLQPEAVDERRDRGLLLLARERFGRAVEDLEAYLQGTEEDSAERLAVEEKLTEARRGLWALN